MFLDTFEDVEDIRVAEERIKNIEKDGTYTSEELKKRLFSPKKTQKKKEVYK